MAKGLAHTNGVSSAGALIEKLMAEIDRIANTPCPLAERERQIAELECEIDRLQRGEETIVVADVTADEQAMIDAFQAVHAYEHQRLSPTFSGSILRPRSPGRYGELIVGERWKPWQQKYSVTYCILLQKEGPAMQLSKWAAITGAAFYVLWGVFHLVAAYSVYDLAQQSSGMVRGRLLQDAFYL